jgi:predicted phosphoribosyltransferase
LIFDIFSQKIKFRFKNRISAALTLSEILKDFIKKADKEHTLVLGIPRAGVLTADIVSKRLGIPNFDIVIPRKLTDQDNKEQAIGAIIDNESIFILPDSQQYFQVSQEYLRSEIASKLLEINRRRRKYGQDFSNESLFKKIKDLKIIILMDDGVATGATMAVTLKWIQKYCMEMALDKKRMIVAAPVIPKSIAEQMINEYAVEIASVFSPSLTSFRSVEQFHQDFKQVTDDQVIKILKER